MAEYPQQPRSRITQLCDQLQDEAWEWTEV